MRAFRKLHNRRQQFLDFLAVIRVAEHRQGKRRLSDENIALYRFK